MELSVDQNRPAWQPFTPHGVAAFARASVGRMLLVQFVAALVAAGATARFLKTDWFPTVSAAIERLPQQGEIRSGRLFWFGESPQLLAESRFLAVAVDLNLEAQAHSPAHLQIEFGRTDLRVYSIFGYAQISYPRAYVLAFSFQELKPWWGAWAPIFLAGAVAVVLPGLMILWAALATLYFLPVWMLGLYFNRGLTLEGSWRLAGAAVLPGAMVMTIAIGCYGLAELDVVRLIAAAILHVLVGWTYLVLGVLAAPKIPSCLELKVNPFRPAVAATDEKTEDGAKADQPNPFHPSGD
jgi:hypothetical protein